MNAPLIVIARRHKYLTNRIPVLSAVTDARVVLLQGEDAMPYEGDTSRVIETMLAFVVGDETRVAEAEAQSVTDLPDPLAGRHLTPREREVINLLAQGKSNWEIAEALVISVRTVERHLMRIYGKFGVSGKSARVIAAAHAILQVT